MNLGYQFSRQSNRMTPFWENRANISGLAGINGNNQDSMNWGPPTLYFSSGLTAMTDAQSSFNRNETNGISFIGRWTRSPHNVTAGFDFKRREFNYSRRRIREGRLALPVTRLRGALQEADRMLQIF